MEEPYGWSVLGRRWVYGGAGRPFADRERSTCAKGCALGQALAVPLKGQRYRQRLRYAKHVLPEEELGIRVLYKYVYMEKEGEPSEKLSPPM